MERSCEISLGIFLFCHLLAWCTVVLGQFRVVNYDFNSVKCYEMNFEQFSIFVDVPTFDTDFSVKKMDLLQRTNKVL